MQDAMLRLNKYLTTPSWLDDVIIHRLYNVHNAVCCHYVLIMGHNDIFKTPEIKPGTERTLVRV